MGWEYNGSNSILITFMKSLILFPLGVSLKIKALNIEFYLQKIKNRKLLVEECL